MDAALEVVRSGGTAIDAVVAGIVVLEDDPRFNAGTGSRVRLDGRTIEMDASLMDSAGRFSAVAVIERVQNPILVARAVRDTPHLVLAGNGATALARAIGLPDYDPATPEMRAKTAVLVERLRRRDPTLHDDWSRFDLRRFWTFETTPEAAGLGPEDIGHDTVGVLVRDGEGRYAAALSTGGTSLTLRGRVGDVPVVGAGLFAGPHGAAAATGVGERIIETASARTAYAVLAEGDPPQSAADRAVAAVVPRGAIGIIVMGGDAMAAASDREMAWAGRVLGEHTWLGPTPAP